MRDTRDLGYCFMGKSRVQSNTIQGYPKPNWSGIMVWVEFGVSRQVLSHFIETQNTLPLISARATALIWCA